MPTLARRPFASIPRHAVALRKAVADTIRAHGLDKPQSVQQLIQREMELDADLAARAQEAVRVGVLFSPSDGTGGAA